MPTNQFIIVPAYHAWQHRAVEVLSKWCQRWCQNVCLQSWGNCVLQPKVLGCKPRLLFSIQSFNPMPFMIYDCAYRVAYNFMTDVLVGGTPL